MRTTKHICHVDACVIYTCNHMYQHDVRTLPPVQADALTKGQIDGNQKQTEGP